MNDIAVSIVVPVYNSDRYLGACLDSILAQTRSDFEVICVDNGSTDASLQILHDKAQQDERVVVLSEPRPGVSCARNAGMARARGDYMLFVDSDDIVEPVLVERTLQAASKHDADLVIYSFDECYDDFAVSFPWARSPYEEGYEHAFSVPELNVPAMSVVTPNVWRILFRSSFLRRLSRSYPEELHSSEDLVFVYEAMFSAERIILLPDILYHYRRDNDVSLTRRDRQAAGIRALEMIEDEYRDIANDSWFSRQYANLIVDTFQYQLWSCVTKDEFVTLYNGLRAKWGDYLEEHKDMVDESYRYCLDRMLHLDAIDYLFGLSSDSRRDAESFKLACERNANWARWAERKRDAVRDELGRVYGSTSWRVARIIAKLLAPMRALANVVKGRTR